MALYRTTLGSDSIVLGNRRWAIVDHMVDIPEELEGELRKADQLAERVPYSPDSEAPPTPGTDGRNKAP